MGPAYGANSPDHWPEEEEDDEEEEPPPDDPEDVDGVDDAGGANAAGVPEPSKVSSALRFCARFTRATAALRLAVFSAAARRLALGAGAFVVAVEEAGRTAATAGVVVAAFFGAGCRTRARSGSALAAT
jgi:hypothetical protein